MSLFYRLITEGKDVSRLAEDLLTFLRDLLLLRTAPDLQDLLELVSGDDRFREMSKGCDPDVLYSFIDILSKTQQEMRFSNHAKVYIESALLKMIHIEGSAFQVQSESNSVINPAIMDKVTELERVVSELQQQIKSGVSTQTGA